MIAYRVFPWEPEARPARPGGALWFPRPLQGHGRHDNPAKYAALYASESEASVVAEALRPFQGFGRLTPGSLTVDGRPLGVAEIAVADDVEIVDLDDPRTLTRERLRPSLVATGERDLTQEQALALFGGHPQAVALRWWSTIEASWLNLTFFGRARLRLKLRSVRGLALEDPSVAEAAGVLGLALP